MEHNKRKNTTSHTKKPKPKPSKPQSLFCVAYLPTPGPRTYLGVWLIYPVIIYWKKVWFPFPSRYPLKIPSLFGVGFVSASPSPCWDFYLI